MSYWLLLKLKKLRPPLNFRFYVRGVAASIFTPKVDTPTETFKWLKLFFVKCAVCFSLSFGGKFEIEVLLLAIANAD